MNPITPEQITADINDGETQLYKKYHKQLKALLLRTTMEATGNKRAQSARLLGISRDTQRVWLEQELKP